MITLKGIQHFIHQVPYLDLIAPCVFLSLWWGYTIFADWRLKTVSGLSQLMHQYRLDWMQQAAKRENRITDANLLGTLSQTSTFFASTTVFILAGLVAMLGGIDTVHDIAIGLLTCRDHEVTRELLLIRVMVLLAIFVYVFFKFTWSLRQLSYAAALIGSMPHESRDSAQEVAASVKRTALILTMAAKHFNRGLRGYYFGLAALMWFLHAWVFLLLSAWVVWVIHRREHRSHLIQLLRASPAEILKS